MKPIPQSLWATLAVTCLASSVVFADDAVRRIDHPNGPATYVTAPGEGRGVLARDNRSSATIGVLAGGRSFGARDQMTRSDVSLSGSDTVTIVPLHHGRGQTDYIRVER
jgi:hypothetical protein